MYGGQEGGAWKSALGEDASRVVRRQYQARTKSKRAGAADIFPRAMSRDELQTEVLQSELSAFWSGYDEEPGFTWTGEASWGGGAAGSGRSRWQGEMALVPPSYKPRARRKAALDSGSFVARPRGSGQPRRVRRVFAARSLRRARAARS